jgi:hypothetical protein
MCEIHLRELYVPSALPASSSIRQS